LGTAAAAILAPSPHARRSPAPTATSLGPPPLRARHHPRLPPPPRASPRAHATAHPAVGACMPAPARAGRRRTVVVDLVKKMLGRWIEEAVW